MFPFSNELGSYRLLRRIGGGGMGEVYLAEDRRMGLTRQVAIKTIRAEVDPYPDQVATSEAERLFRREMQVIATLDHPFILPLYDFGEVRTDETILTYMVMPFRPEGSLANWLQKRGTTKPLALEETAHFVEQAAQALQHAHTHDLIHLDVKPANFLIRDRSDHVLPDILLSDFGIVKIATATATASQSIRGTPSYMAPEQWDGHPVAATDQYALAVMAYLLLTRQFPFKGSMEQVMRQHLDKQPSAPSLLNPIIPPDLDSVILHALQKSPKDRFASISAFANAFKQAIRPRESASLPVVKEHSETIRPSSPPPEHALLTKPSEAPPVSGLAPTVYAEPATPPIPPTVTASSGSLSTGDISLPATTESDPQPEKETVPPLARASLLPPPPEIQSNRPSHKRTFITLGAIFLLIIVSVLSGVAIHQNQVNLDTQATVSAQSTATAQTIAANPCPSYIQQCGSLSLALIDPLQSWNYFSAGSNTSVGGSCGYVNNTFQVKEASSHNLFICNEEQNFSDFVFEVQMNSIQGDCGGMMVRYDLQTSRGYLLEVCPHGIFNGTVYYKITKYSSFKGHDTFTALGSGQNVVISSSGTNKLAVAINKGLITLYINQQVVASATDSSFLPSGLITLVADNYTNPTIATYTNARVWA